MASEMQDGPWAKAYSLPRAVDVGPRLQSARGPLPPTNGCPRSPRVPAETSVVVRRRVSPSQGWRTFLRNHADGIAAMDLFVVPTISFRLLYGLLIMGHGRRQLLWVGVTAHPTAEWIANQLTEACGWEQIPRYLIRDRDRAYGEISSPPGSLDRHSDRPTSPAPPGKMHMLNG